MIVDYYIVRKGNLHVPALYDPSKGSLYMFSFGTNFRAVFAWLGGMAMGLPGLIAAYQPKLVGVTATRMYSMAWILTTFMAMFLYAVVCLIFPVRVYPAAFSEIRVKWEFLGPSDGFFDGESHHHGLDPDNSQVSWTNSADDHVVINEKSHDKV